jgi:uncharacterized membrane protein YgdD (TMEM256/DUF423 family)
VQFPRLFLTLGAVGCGIAVALGAFAAHGLKARIEPASLAVFQTGVTYQFFHSLALCVLALWLRQAGRTFGFGDAAIIAGFAFVAGVLMFSVSLYALALGAPRWIGPITPLGGLAFIIGWSAFAWSALRD